MTTQDTNEPTQLDASYISEKSDGIEVEIVDETVAPTITEASPLNPPAEPPVQEPIAEPSEPTVVPEPTPELVEILPPRHSKTILINQ